MYGKWPAPRALHKELRALGARQDLEIVCEATSLMTSAEFVAAVEAAYERISPDRKKFGAITPHAAYTSVSLAVWEAPDADATVRALKRAPAPLEVRAHVTARPTQNPEDVQHSARWSDSSPFSAGAAITFRAASA